MQINFQIVKMSGEICEALGDGWTIQCGLTHLVKG